MSPARRPEPVEFEEHRPLYARVLRLRHLAPSGFMCFVFLEGAVALGILLALAELVSWWGVLVLPATVAVMVKLNDLIAGMLGEAAAATAPIPAMRPATVTQLRPAGMVTERAPGTLVGEQSTARLGRVWPGGLTASRHAGQGQPSPARRWPE